MDKYILREPITHYLDGVHPTTFKPGEYTEEELTDTVVKLYRDKLEKKIIPDYDNRLIPEYETRNDQTDNSTSKRTGNGRSTKGK